MKITYDPEADAVSIDLEGSGPGRAVRTEHLDDRRFVDYDAEARIIGIELLDGIYRKLGMKALSREL